MRDTIPQQLNDIREDVDKLKELLMLCRVSETNQKNRTVKVILDDGETVSEEFPVLQRTDTLKRGSGAPCPRCTYQGCRLEPWFPKKGDTVVCLVRPGGDGIVLGGV